MLTTAGATFLTSGAKVRLICSREVGTVCAATGPAASSRAAATASAQWRKRRSSINDDLTKTAKGSRTPAASCVAPHPTILMRSFRGGRLLGRRRRAGILALGVGVAIDQLDHRHRRLVAIAEARLEHAGIAAGARGIALGQRAEQLGRQLGVAQHRQRLAAGMQVAAL